MSIHNVSFDRVRLLDGFWQKRAELNSEVSIYAVQKRFEESGRFDAVRFAGGEVHVYYDSDVAKWIEAVAYIARGNNPKYADLIAFCDELIASMVKHQRADGYFNSYFQQKEPTEVFKRRNDHELYCAGHIMEAAVAYDKYLSKGDLLGLAERYADYIEKVFVIDKSAGFATCGHEEIELALFKLYRHTGKDKYRNLAEYFINARGNNDKDTFTFTQQTFQDNAPARELAEAEGHAVRAMYYYSAMADMANISGDKELEAACRRLFDNIVTQKMYITGGIGSTRLGEAFTTGYDLPSLTAYAETCAGIGLILFCMRLSELGVNGEYADVIERVMYNVLLSSTSLDGKSFFYENPLEICRKEKGKETAVVEARRPVLPIWKRREVFDCSCCPPNLNRFIASLAGVIYTETEDGVFVNQYISSTLGGLRIETNYPNEKTVKISGKGYAHKKLFVRIPAWCKGYKIEIGGKEISAKAKNGYAQIDVTSDFSAVLSLDFAPKFIEANPHVRDLAGKVCLVNGPVVYCLEEVDNGGDLYSLYVRGNEKNFTAEMNKSYGLQTFCVEGKRKVARNNAPLYADSFKTQKVTLKFMPYFAFANREESDMTVWVHKG